MKEINKNAWFIVFIPFTILWCIFGGCKENRNGTIITVSNSEVTVTGRKDFINLRLPLHHYVINQCEYYGDLTGTSGNHLTHSGTCPNLIHKCKCD